METKILLSEREMPRQWYNIMADMPKSSHAIKAAIDEALRCREEGKERCILFNLSGHGYLDLAAYADHTAGKLVDYEYPDQAIRESLKKLPVI